MFGEARPARRTNSYQRFELEKHIGRLSSDQQDDIAKELVVTIEDMAVDRAKGKEPTHKIVESALNELGEPELLAQRYNKGSPILLAQSGLAHMRVCSFGSQ